MKKMKEMKKNSSGEIKRHTREGEKKGQDAEKNSACWPVKTWWLPPARPTAGLD